MARSVIYFYFSHCHNKDTCVLHLQYFKQRVQNQAEIKSKRKTHCDGHGSQHLISQ